MVSLIVEMRDYSHKIHNPLHHIDIGFHHAHSYTISYP